MSVHFCLRVSVSVCLRMCRTDAGGADGRARDASRAAYDELVREREMVEAVVRKIQQEDEAYVPVCCVVLCCVVLCCVVLYCLL